MWGKMAERASYQNFEHIYEEYDPVIKYKTMQKIGKVTPDWEDVRSETYLSLYKTLSGSSFRGDCSIGTLIYVIVQRRIADFMRTKYKAKKIMESLEFSYQEIASSSPEDILIIKEILK